MSNITDNHLTAKTLHAICSLDSATFRKQFKTNGYINGKTLKDHVDKCVGEKEKKDGWGDKDRCGDKGRHGDGKVRATRI
jgi:hypothetical protein